MSRTYHLWDTCHHCDHILALHLGPVRNWSRLCSMPGCLCSGVSLHLLPQEMFADPRERLVNQSEDSFKFPRNPVCETGCFRVLLKEKHCLNACYYLDDDPANHYLDDDSVNHPSHYTEHPSGVECIQITEHMNFCLGNAIKYIWRVGLKSTSPLEDLKKAQWYLSREIERLEKL